MGICMEGISHFGKLWEDILSLVLIYLKEIFVSGFWTHTYIQYQTINISLRSMVEVITPILEEISWKRNTHPEFSKCSPLPQSLPGLKVKVIEFL